MDKIIIHLDFAKILGILSLIAVVLTVVLFLLAKNNRFIKYIPGLILFTIGLYNLLYLGKDSSVIEGIDRLYMIITSIISGFIGLSTGLIIGIVKKPKKY